MRVTGIGGGHGLATTLAAARRYASEVRAVVAVADDGGSSGQLTRDLGIPPPGDIRNCLAALAGDEELAAVFQHRFDSGAMTGHTVGNLVIAALAEMRGDYGVAVAEAGRLLRAVGEVFPSTTRLVSLRAVVEGGVVRGQVAVAQSPETIRKVYLEPEDPPAPEGAIEAIMTADQIVMGPGSLYTSLIATLLVPGIAAAVRRTRATRVFVCNSRMQKGETTGLDAVAHVDALQAHLGPTRIDYIVVQHPEVAEDAVHVDRARLEDMGLEVVQADLSGGNGHDPERLAGALRDLRPGKMDK